PASGTDPPARRRRWPETPSAHPRPRRELSLQQDEQCVRRDRQRDREYRADEQRRREELLNPLEDEEAKPSLADQRGHRRQPDGRDRRDANPRDDHRRGEGQL